MNKKGVVLVVSMIAMIVVLVLVGAYFSGLLTEKRAADTEKLVLQALGLAEAGANHAKAELIKRVSSDLKATIENTNINQVKNDLEAYYAEVNSLGLLDDYTQFSVSSNQATFAISNSNLYEDVGKQDNYIYNATVTIEPDPNYQVNPDRLPLGSDKYIYTFYYKYKIESGGQITEPGPSIQRDVKLLNGTFTIEVHPASFAENALFTNHHCMPSGTTVWFTANTNFTGPVHTNDGLAFANNPSGSFSAAVTQHLTKATFFNNYSPINLDADSNPPYDVPNFYAGFRRGVDLINLPSSITQQDLKEQATGGQNDGPWDGGIYLPNAGGSLVGGVYIKGDASNLTMSVDANNRQVYTITYDDGNWWTTDNTKKITVDYANNQTIVTNLSGSGGTPPDTYSGIPDGMGQDPADPQDDQGTIVYGNGRISNFSGTVQSDTALTVSSDSDIGINNHIRYQSYNPGPPLNALGYNNLLGILTWNGNVRINTSAPNNLDIHGVVMAAGRNGIFTVDNYNQGFPRGTVNLLGGAITDFYGPFGTFWGTQQISGYGRNFIYDARMLEGRSPPYFPYKPFFTSSVGGFEKKLMWQE